MVTTGPNNPTGSRPNRCPSHSQQAPRAELPSAANPSYSATLLAGACMRWLWRCEVSQTNTESSRMWIVQAGVRGITEETGGDSIHYYALPRNQAVHDPDHPRRIDWRGRKAVSESPWRHPLRARPAATSASSCLTTDLQRNKIECFQSLTWNARSLSGRSNDFDEVVFGQYPEQALLKKRLVRAGAR
jgi:hypothetical protein